MANSHSSPTTHVSAPGKVLLAGGYLVLDQRFQGLVIAIDSRFHVIVKERKVDEMAIPGNSNIGTSSEKIQIIVKSPQFLDGVWNFVYDVESATLKQLLAADDQENKFVAAALSFSLGFIVASNEKRDNGSLLIRNGYGLEISIFADNDFYSQLDYLESMRMPVNLESLGAVPRFNSTNSRIRDVKKTGLGSSAAMTSSLVAAVLHHFNSVDIVNPSDLDIVHNIAQASHCLAQGKIGSGFDVCSAIYGSHCYQRFSPSLLTPLFESDTLSARMPNPVYTTLSQKWDCKVAPTNLPPGFFIQLGDISTGSNTPSMVSKLLAWRKENERECEDQWKYLDSRNMELVALFSKLQDFYERNEKHYLESLHLFSQRSMKQWESFVADDFGSLHLNLNEVNQSFIRLALSVYTCFQAIRRSMKAMGNSAGISIEPDAQTALLDECLTVPGVLMAGVPGAGGYDAIFCILAGGEARDKLLAGWEKTKSVTPLLSSATSKGVTLE